jgi:hypothetical protein
MNMAFADICSEELLSRLKTTPKHVTNWIAKNRKKPSHMPSHIEWTCEAISIDGDTFIIYMRQNINLDDDFSCGIAWKSPDGEQITIARYNGSSHDHTNKSDGAEFVQQCHIHQTTVEAAQRGWSLESHAILAEAYTCLDEAKLLLADDYVISGLVPNVNQLLLSWN